MEAIEVELSVMTLITEVHIFPPCSQILTPTEEEGVVQNIVVVTRRGLYTLGYNQLQEQEGVQETNENSSAEVVAGNFSIRL